MQSTARQRSTGRGSQAGSWPNFRHNQLSSQPTFVTINFRYDQLSSQSTFVKINFCHMNSKDFHCLQFPSSSYLTSQLMWSGKVVKTPSYNGFIFSGGGWESRYIFALFFSWFVDVSLFFLPIFEKSLRRVEIILSRCHQQQRQVRLRGALNAQQAGKIKTLKAIYFDQISERKKLAGSKSICLHCKLYLYQS